jgi:glycine cleavage system H lipoate-binding protein
LLPLLIFSVTCIFFLIYHFLFGWRKEALASKNGFLSLSKIGHMLPTGVFIQPSFTWGKVLETGNLMLGIQPMLMGLVGQADEIELMKQTATVIKGDILIKIRKGEKVLKIKSPVTGEIASVNNLLLEESDWKNLSQNWIFSIKPENIGSEIGNWYSAEQSSDWINNTFQQIKNFLKLSIPHTQLGITMADGGDIPVGILSQFDKKIWSSFEEKFIE